MKKYVLFILMWVICYSQNLHAQKQGQERIDSLINCLKTAPEDTNTLSILGSLADGPDGVWENYTEKLGILAQKLMRSDIPSIKKSAKDAYAFYLNNKAFAFVNQGNYKEALEYYNQAINIFKEIGEDVQLILELSNIGAIYDREGEPDKALESYLSALKISYDKEKTGKVPKPTLIGLLINISVIYNGKKDRAKELEYLKKAEKIVLEIGELYDDVPYVYNSLSFYYQNQNDSLAFYYAKKSYETANKIGTNIGKVRGMNCMAQIYLKQGNLAQALSLAKESLDIAIKLKFQKEILLSAEILKKIYQSLGDYKHAFEMYDIWLTARDSIQSKENQKAVMRHQFQSDFDLKQAKLQAEQDKKNIQQRNIRNSISAGLAGMLIFSVVVYRQRNKVKNEKKNVEKEKARSEELLLNILPAEVAEELKENGRAEARAIDEVTVLFTDFKGFTQLSEKLSPKALVAEINACFSAFDSIMQKYGVEKIKTIGDSYMAAGGLPTPNKTHPDDVVQAALEIQQYMLEHKKRKEAAGELFFEIRIGVHTGPVVAGIVGVKKFQYDIWGDTVNTASRMESSSEVGKVNISGSTYELVKDKFTCTYRGEIDAKGKGKMKMYYVG